MKRNNPYVKIKRKDFKKINFDQIDNDGIKPVVEKNTSQNNNENHDPNKINFNKIKSSSNNSYILKQEAAILNGRHISGRLRRIHKRSIALSIFYTIITFGIYGIFWQFEIAKETNAITEDDKCATPALVVFLSIITCGIYRVYWAYQTGLKHNAFYDYNFNEDKNFHILYLVLHICNYFIPIFNLICFAIMQAKLNIMLVEAKAKTQHNIYVKDSSIFNRPVWSTILLFAIVEFFPVLFSSIYELLFAKLPGNPFNVSVNANSAVDVVQQTIQTSANQIINADTPFMLGYSIINILLVVAVLWWFKMRFKHSGYTGVLVFQNLGRACLFALPGLVFVLLNVIGLNFNNFKIGIVLLGFIPGFVEEITFRGMIIPNFMRIYNRSKGIWLSLFVTSGIFGVVHAGNIFAGADAGMTAFQVFYAFALGMLFAGIFIRTGNLWPCILIHGLTDAFAMMSDEALKQGAVQTQAFTLSWDVIPIVVISLIYIFYAIWICRPKKHNEIINVWEDKWGNAVLNK